MAKEKKRNRLSTFIILLGLFCLLGGGGLALYNVWDGMRAEKASADIMEKLVDVIGDSLDVRYSGGTSDAESVVEDPADDANKPGRTKSGKLRTTRMEDPLKDPNREMPTAIIDGYNYIGFLEIPSLGLSLPVMFDWDYERLHVSPCRYSGSYYSDDLVICAHNYARHFSPVKWINMNADVYFTNVAGETIHYVTNNIETVQPTAIEAMIENSNNSDFSQNDWDLTLFTCNTGGQTRCAVRCVRAEE